MPNLLKQTAIAHSMIQAVGPRSVLCPIPFGLGVQLDKEFSSKWLISHLRKLGFSISPDKVQKYKQSSVVLDGKENTQEIEKADEIEEQDQVKSILLVSLMLQIIVFLLSGQLAM